MSQLSVIICTHNPREDYLRRTLESLEKQTLPREQWELLLIDNASNEPLASKWDLTWHPQGRHLLEEELGLTPARLRGIREAKGELLVFVDDDNVLSDDYLANTASIAENYCHVGVWSGEIVPDFEIQPPTYIDRFWSYLALVSVPRSYWSSITDDWCRLPFGAGMCMRTSIAVDYMRLTTLDALRHSLGRKGTSLSSCEDTDLALHACDLGYGYGRFSELSLVHIIPASRLQLRYLLNLEEGLAASSQVLRFLREGIKPQVPEGPRRILGRLRRLLTMSRLDRAIFEARIRGSQRAIATIRQNTI